MCHVLHFFCYNRSLVGRQHWRWRQQAENIWPLLIKLNFWKNLKPLQCPKKSLQEMKESHFHHLEDFWRTKISCCKIWGGAILFSGKEKRRCRNNPESSEESEDEGSNINLILALKVVRKYAQKSNMANDVKSEEYWEEFNYGKEQPEASN